MIKVTFRSVFCLAVRFPHLPTSPVFHWCLSMSGQGRHWFWSPESWSYQGFAILTLNLTAWPCLSLVKFLRTRDHG